ncbi:hypothetical protein [Noviherbaspirillum agri]
MSSLFKPAVAWTVFLVLLAIWSVLALLTHDHGCTLVGMTVSCNGFIAKLGFYNLLFGWVPVMLALFLAGGVSVRKVMSSRPQQ